MAKNQDNLPDLDPEAIRAARAALLDRPSDKELAESGTSPSKAFAEQAGPPGWAADLPMTPSDEGLGAQERKQYSPQLLRNLRAASAAHKANSVPFMQAQLGDVAKSAAGLSAEENAGELAQMGGPFNRVLLKALGQIERELDRPDPNEVLARAVERSARENKHFWRIAGDVMPGYADAVRAVGGLDRKTQAAQVLQNMQTQNIYQKVSEISRRKAETDQKAAAFFQNLETLGADPTFTPDRFAAVVQQMMDTPEGKEILGGRYSGQTAQSMQALGGLLDSTVAAMQDGNGAAQIGNALTKETLKAQKTAQGYLNGAAYVAQNVMRSGGLNGFLDQLGQAPVSPTGTLLGNYRAKRDRIFGILLGNQWPLFKSILEADDKSQAGMQAVQSGKVWRPFLDGQLHEALSTLEHFRTLEKTSPSVMPFFQDSEYAYLTMELQNLARLLNLGQDMSGAVASLGMAGAAVQAPDDFMKGVASIASGRGGPEDAAKMLQMLQGLEGMMGPAFQEVQRQGGYNLPNAVSVGRKGKQAMADMGARLLARDVYTNEQEPSNGGQAAE